MKDFLEKNKIYFSTLSASLIALSSLFVSCSSYQIAKQQAEISKVGLSPHFYLQEDGYYDERVRRLTELTLYIKNSGGPVNALDSQLCSIIELEFSVQGQRVTKMLALRDFYDMSSYSMEPNGTAITYVGHKNNDLYFDLYFQVRDFQFKKENEPILMGLKHAIKLDYTNQLDEKSTNYFIGVNRSDIAETKKLFNVCNQAIIQGSPYYLFEISLNDIVSVVEGKNT